MKRPYVLPCPPSLFVTFNPGRGLSGTGFKGNGRKKHRPGNARPPQERDSPALRSAAARASQAAGAVFLQGKNQDPAPERIARRTDGIRTPWGFGARCP